MLANSVHGWSAIHVSQLLVTRPILLHRPAQIYLLKSLSRDEINVETNSDETPLPKLRSTSSDCLNNANRADLLGVMDFVRGMS